MSNLTIIKDGQAVTTSRQVAEKFGKRHDNVIRDIENIIGSIPNFEDTQAMFYKSDYEHPQNKQAYHEYIMNRDGFTLLAMGFTGSDAMQWKIKYIQAFNEMELQLNQQFQIPQTLSQALLLASQQAEKIEQQTKELEIAKPKVEFFDAVADSKDAIQMNDAAKVLGIKGMGRNNLFEFLRENKILINNNRPYQKYTDAGYFRVIEQKYMKQGEECITFKTLVYQKGLNFIRKLLIKDAEMATI